MIMKTELIKENNMNQEIYSFQETWIEGTIVQPVKYIGDQGQHAK